jgi:hypothetical protein
MIPDKQQLEEALKIYDKAIEDDTLNELWLDKHGKQVHHEVQDAAQFLLDNHDDITAILEARKCATEGEWYDNDGIAIWSLFADGSLNYELLEYVNPEDGNFITTAANRINDIKQIMEKEDD